MAIFKSASFSHSKDWDDIRQRDKISTMFIRVIQDRQTKHFKKKKIILKFNIKI